MIQSNFSTFIIKLAGVRDFVRVIQNKDTFKVLDEIYYYIVASQNINWERKICVGIFTYPFGTF